MKSWLLKRASKNPLIPAHIVALSQGTPHSSSTFAEASHWDAAWGNCATTVTYDLIWRAYTCYIYLYIIHLFGTSRSRYLQRNKVYIYIYLNFNYHIFQPTTNTTPAAHRAAIPASGGWNKRPSLAEGSNHQPTNPPTCKRSWYLKN